MRTVAVGTRTATKPLYLGADTGMGAVAAHTLKLQRNTSGSMAAFSFPCRCFASWIGGTAHANTGLRRKRGPKDWRLGGRVSICMETVLRPAQRAKLLESFERTGLVKLDPSLHKGQCGRVMIVGGSKEYTGAPYYAGISALRAGADLVHVMCSSEAVGPLKGYSPELMVHGILPSTATHPMRNEDPKHNSFSFAQELLDDAAALVQRIDALVVGPGLGRDSVTIAFVEALLVQVARERQKTGRDLSLVFDADGLALVKYKSKLFDANSAGLLPGPVFLTPNVVEYGRLADTWREGLDPACSSAGELRAEPTHLARVWGPRMIIVEKGPRDIIASGDEREQAPLVCNEPGSLRRCGGQGDVLAGVLTCFAAMQAKRGQTDQGRSGVAVDLRLAAFAACTLVRASAAAAFEKKRRSMLTTDVIEHLPERLEIMFPTSYHEETERPQSG
ncbi:ATP-dependent (S)-NAD(P)H-hydrate dehydratase [Porphyridium purpureum]|uniref:ATP-dependent (S)-NAD(P)H-hydrate dehydratase n=1 Tax=Porphyridium purpureum TaxID=35688 RepID=A0A5J4Z4J2_PORPP|nr:ATP-dependent (S)-NAD(P)H-hydrate dehydratase [Porphyridium purpureum]|eukprot:POR6948..scf295_1